MGLDMYLEGRESYSFGHPSLDAKPFPIVQTTYSLGYWKKHPNLHGFIVRKFAAGEDNCDDIFFCKEDILKIIEAIKDNALPHTEGFFFGASDLSEEQKAKDVAIFEAAIVWFEAAAPNAWRDVCYKASW